MYTTMIKESTSEALDLFYRNRLEIKISWYIYGGGQDHPDVAMSRMDNLANVYYRIKVKYERGVGSEPPNSLDIEIFIKVSGDRTT